MLYFSMFELFVVLSIITDSKITPTLLILRQSNTKYRKSIKLIVNIFYKYIYTYSLIVFIIQGILLS